MHLLRPAEETGSAGPLRNKYGWRQADLNGLLMAKNKKTPLVDCIAIWKPLPESNRRKRSQSPLHCRCAKRPWVPPGAVSIRAAIKLMGHVGEDKGSRRRTGRAIRTRCIRCTGGNDTTGGLLNACGSPCLHQSKPRSIPYLSKNFRLADPVILSLVVQFPRNLWLYPTLSDS